MEKRPGAIGAWIQASRLPTLWAAFAPVAVGSACAARAGCFDLYAAIACLLGAVLIQLGTNYANDLYDHRKGADGQDRLGPTRAVAAGWLSERAMMTGTVVAFAAATLVGLELVRIAGWPIVVIGVASLAAGLLYTAGPIPFAYTGLGEVFVLVFFGFVAVCGTAYVQCGSIPATAWLGSVAVGSLATAILVVNNLRDHEGDRRAGKRTLIVRFGADFGRAELVALVVFAYVVLAAFWWWSAPGALLALASLPLAWRAVDEGSRLRGAALNPVLGRVARLQMAFCVLLAVGLAFL